MTMKRLITLFALLFCVALAGILSAGEDAGIAGAAYVRGFKKNASKQVAENVTLSDGSILELATGSLSNLSLRFRTDTNTGIFDLGDGLNFAVGGATRFQINTSYLLSTIDFVPSGTQARVNFATANSSTVPAFTFGGNTNTGVGRYQVGEPSMVASGVEAMRWTASQTLAFAGGANTYLWPQYSFTNDTNTGFYGNGADALGWVVGGTVFGYINSTGFTFGTGGNGPPFIKSSTPTIAAPTYSWMGATNSGLGYYTLKQPNIIASGTEAQRWIATGTIMNVPVIIATDCWDDLTVQVTAVNRAGTPLSDPTLDVAEDLGALTFLGAGGAGTANEIAAIVQMPHTWKPGVVSPHIHVRNKTAGNGTATWELWYKAADVLEAFPAGYTVATTSYLVPAATDTHQMIDLGDINLSTYGDSAVIMFFLRRTQGATSDTSSTDINLLSFDIHYQKNRLGSTGEYGDR